MKRWLRIGLLASLTVAAIAAGTMLTVATAPAPALAAASRGAGQDSGLPPLIDRELFFGDPQISGSQVSPDGRHISFIKPYNGIRNIWVKGLDEAFEAARPVTADTRPIPFYFWSQDGRFLLYVQDKGGNENYHVYAVDPAAAPAGDSGVPAATDLTPVEGVRAAIYSVPERNPGFIIVGLNDRDPAFHDVYRVDLATGERELLIKNTMEASGWIFDLEGDVRLATKEKDGGGTQILRVEGENLVPIYEVTYLEEANPVRFHKDGERVYMVTNKGEKTDLTELVLLDPRTGKTEPVERDPKKQVDFGGALFSESTEELIATFYIGDRLRIYPKDKQFAADLKLIQSKLPDGDIFISSSTSDMRLHVVGVQSDVDPGSAYLYDRQSGEVELLYRSRPELPSEHLAPMKPVTYESTDGLEIPAYLTLPRGVPPKNLPVVIHPHGGPWARDTWGYDPYAQFLANRGYAVLQPNFRGSSGYGKEFLNAGNREWGTGLMQHDLTAGVKWLIEEGIADPARVGIFGGSYGGYATLAGVTFTPELYAAGVPYVAPSNLITLIESFPAYWRPFLEGSWYKRVGDPAVPADREDLLARSPLLQVERIQAPLLVVHGANDPRVKQRESDQIVLALREKGRPVEYIVAPDEGHGFQGEANRLALAAAMEKFLARHLGGRYQETMTPEVEARLAEITVDPQTVALPDESDEALAQQAMEGELPAADGTLIQPASLQYAVKLQMAGQTFDMEMTREVAQASVDGREAWRIADAAETPMGASTDTVFVDAQTLLPLRRIAGGMGTMDLTYGTDAITGQMGAMGRTMDVQVPLTGPVLSDGPGLELALAALPLSRGYRTTLRAFESTSQKIRPMALEVTGSQEVRTPAGTFETWTVELKPLDGDEGGAGTLQLMRAVPHWVVTSTYKLPAGAGGGSLSTELTGGAGGSSAGE